MLKIYTCLLTYLHCSKMKHLNICRTKRAFLEIRPSNSSKTTKKSVKHKTMNVERGENIKVGQFKDKGEKN